MEKVDIRIQLSKDNYPFDLLLLADESIEAINKYINACSVFEILLNNKMIGIMAVMINNDNTIELKNIAISKRHHKEWFWKTSNQFARKLLQRKRCENHLCRHW